MKKSTALIICIMALASNAHPNENPDTVWGPVQHIEFSQSQLPENLYAKFTGNMANSVLQYCLPASYSKSKSYPLVVYVPGYHGHRGGNIENAKDIARGFECVVVSLPLFKAAVDSAEIGNGVIMGFEDYPILARAYKVMLEEFYRAVPNIDRDRSAMVGFSNGAIAIAVMVSSHNRYVLERFHSFCLVDQGMFHLTDLHKDMTRERRFLVLFGDEMDYGRELKIRGARLVEDSYKMLGVSLECRILEKTGHELTDACKNEIGMWIFE